MLVQLKHMSLIRFWIKLLSMLYHKVNSNSCFKYVSSFNFQLNQQRDYKSLVSLFFQADPPDTAKIPADDAVGVTVVLITASYREQEFVRVGYYVTNEYEDEELRELPPTEPQFNKLIRSIAANEPRVTKFKINWDSQKASNSNTNSNGASTALTTNTASALTSVIDLNKENISSSSNDKLTEQKQQQQVSIPSLNENSNFNNVNLNEASCDSAMMIQQNRN